MPVELSEHPRPVDALLFAPGQLRNRPRGERGDICKVHRPIRGSVGRNSAEAASFRAESHHVARQEREATFRLLCKEHSMTRECCRRDRGHRYAFHQHTP